jgi:glycerate kinase
MKIILAPDKFKSSLTGIAFCDLVEAGIKTINPDFEILKLPLADGGDGTIDVVKYYLNGEIIQVEVNNPVFEPVLASYLFSKITKTAFIEMAEASGMKILKSKDKNCMYTSTYGTGELILHAINNGANHIILGLGGSATNDCGIGMARALGFRFLDKNKEEVQPIGCELSNIIEIDATGSDKRLNSIKIQVACDVANPLYGLNGSAFVYAKQKGASESDISHLNSGLKSFSKVLDNHFHIKTQEIKGAGAAGGMGAGTVAFLNGELLPGIDVIKLIANFDSKIKKADWIITGEGRLDDQTLSGKTLSGVLTSANKNQIKVAVFCGSIDLKAEKLNTLGIAYSDSIINKAKNLDDALVHTALYLKQITKEFTNFISE